MRALVALILFASVAVAGYLAWDNSRQSESGESGKRLALTEPVAVQPEPEAQPQSPPPETEPQPDVHEADVQAADVQAADVQASAPAVEQSSAQPSEQPAASETPSAEPDVAPTPSSTQASAPAPASEPEPAPSPAQVVTAPAQPVPQATEEQEVALSEPAAAPQVQVSEPVAVAPQAQPSETIVAATPKIQPSEPAVATPQVQPSETIVAALPQVQSDEPAGSLPQAPPSEPTVATPQVQPSETTVAASQAQPDEPAVAVAPASDVPASPPEEASAEAPTFDIVRVSPEGAAVIAGRAAPGSQVVVSDDETVIAEVTADARGEWVVVPEAPLAPGTRELGLVERTVEGETVESESVVVIAVPERKVVVAEPTAEPTAAKAEAPEVIAVLVPREGGGGSEVLQEPTAGVGLKGQENLSLDTIEYDDQGKVALGGRGAENSEIIVYMDNEFIGRDKVDPDSDWSVVPEQAMPPGLHQLRIDQVDATGKVIARIETPFASAEFGMPASEEGVVVVQPGNSLWRIARRMYGGGLQYVVIYEANRDQIGDPDLIYPGQIFVLPRVN